MYQASNILLFSAVTLTQAFIEHTDFSTLECYWRCKSFGHIWFPADKRIRKCNFCLFAVLLLHCLALKAAAAHFPQSLVLRWCSSDINDVNTTCFLRNKSVNLIVMIKVDYLAGPTNSMCSAVYFWFPAPWLEIHISAGSSPTATKSHLWRSPTLALWETLQLVQEVIALHYGRHDWGTVGMCKFGPPGGSPTQEEWRGNRTDGGQSWVAHILLSVCPVILIYANTHTHVGSRLGNKAIGNHLKKPSLKARQHMENSTNCRTLHYYNSWTRKHGMTLRKPQDFKNCCKMRSLGWPCRKVV